MDNDDRMVGRLLTRRDVLALLGAVGAGALAGRASGQIRVPKPPATVLGPSFIPVPACVVRPAQTEGPYFVDEKLNRTDIRSDPATGSVKDGAPLELELHVSRVAAGGCAPIAGAMVDIWQCDAAGVYSDVADGNGLFNTKGQKFLRGYQVTDEQGSAKFRTIYPGWYQGRTVHIHFKIRMPASGGRSQEFTSQLYFDDAVTDQVLANAPYIGQGERRVRNAGDGIFRDEGGKDLILSVNRNGDQYAGTFDIGMSVG